MKRDDQNTMSHRFFLRANRERTEYEPQTPGVQPANVITRSRMLHTRNDNDNSRNTQTGLMWRFFGGQPFSFSTKSTTNAEPTPMFAGSSHLTFGGCRRSLVTSDLFKNSGSPPWNRSVSKLDCPYPLVIQYSSSKWPSQNDVSFPITNGDFP